MPMPPCQTLPFGPPFPSPTHWTSEVSADLQSRISLTADVPDGTSGAWRWPLSWGSSSLWSATLLSTVQAMTKAVSMKQAPSSKGAPANC